MESLPLLHLSVVAIEKAAFGSPLTKVADFTYCRVYLFVWMFLVKFLFYVSVIKFHIKFKCFQTFYAFVFFYFFKCWFYVHILFKFFYDGEFSIFVKVVTVCAEVMFNLY